MELIAAQDDARAAREETRRVKAELAFVEADRHKVRCERTDMSPTRNEQMSQACSIADRIYGR